eukprot:8258850-Pyramimonas_sp.AAC.2
MPGGERITSQGEGICLRSPSHNTHVAATRWIRWRVLSSPDRYYCLRGIECTKWQLLEGSFLRKCSVGWSCGSRWARESL